jgi:hypothetical protein
MQDPIENLLSQPNEDDYEDGDRPVIPKWILQMNNPLKTKWDLTVMALATWNCFTIPLTVSFEPPVFDSTLIFVINSLIDIMFVCDIIISCRTTFINKKTEEEVFSPWMIWREYSKSRLWVDLSATIPFDLLIELGTGKKNRYFQILGILKLGRVLRLSRIIQDLKVTADAKLFLKLLKLCFFLIMYLHCMACFWFLLVRIQGDKWIPIIDYNNAGLYTNIYTTSIARQYGVSLHAAVLLLAGNDVGPRTTE